MMKRHLLWLVCALMTVSLTAQDSNAPRELDLGRVSQPGQATFFDGPAYASTTGKPIELGDYDGDGCGDLALTGHNARGGAGHVKIIFGACQYFGASFDLIDPALEIPVLEIDGRDVEMLGTELVHADFNGDGFADLLLGAQNALNADRTLGGAGAAYIIFGRADLSKAEAFSTDALPADVLAIYGPEFESRLGIWVEAGDFDGDGFQDALIGANQADGPESPRRPNAGEVFVIYGAEDLAGGVIDLSEPPADVTMIIGADPDDLLGSTVYGADINMDGIDDLLLSAAIWRGSAGIGGLATGAADGPANARYNSGETVILFGSPDLRGETIDLAELIDEEGRPVDESLSVVYGPEANDFMGEEIAVGDMNGDGQNDLALGSLATPGRDNLRTDGGEAWVIYLDEAFPGSVIDLAESGAGIVIYAAEADSKGGDTMLIGDMDSDGIGDLLYGAPNANYTEPDGQLRLNNGLLYILYGTEEGFPNEDGLIDFLEPPADLRYDVWLGADNHDMSAYAMSMLDVNDDGVPDVAVNGMNGDGPDNRRIDAGEVYLIDGATFASYDPSAVVATPEATSEATAEVEPTAEAEEEATAESVPLELLPTMTAAEGEALYNRSCAGCHGLNGEGLPGIGYPFIGDPFVHERSDAELLAFIRHGRSAADPDSKMGRVMPPSGGNPALSDAELLAIIQHIRLLGED
jgi:cytochrome c5